MIITMQQFDEISRNKKDPNHKYVIMKHENGVTIYYIKF